VSGGLSLADGFEEMMAELIDEHDFPIKISTVRRVPDPITAVAHGCLLASQL
jgi:hypothetical protein